MVKGFPTARQMHPFEWALLDLTLGVESYEKRLSKLNGLRISCLEVPLPPHSHPLRFARCPSLVRSDKVMYS